MKSLRQLCAALVLALVLELSAFAGEMSTTIASPPPPPPQGNMSTTVACDMTTGIADTDTATEVALNLLQSLLTLL